MRGDSYAAAMAARNIEDVCDGADDERFYPHQEVAAISLWQPWASAMVPYGLKIIETRSWAPKYRGYVAIHAAKRKMKAEELDTHAWQELLSAMAAARLAGGGPAELGDLPRGALLGVVELVDVCPVEEIRDDLGARERRWGNYSDGRYAWITRPVYACPVPVPAIGQRGFWTLPVGTLAPLPAAVEVASGCAKCLAAGRLVCLCAGSLERHAKTCRYRRAAELSVELACPHNLQACPECDPCDCGAGQEVGLR